MDESLIFRDNDLSASKFSTKPRPGYLLLLDAIRAGRVRLIVVTEVSRLCRNLADAIEIIALTKETPFTTVETTGGVEATGGARYDLTTVQGEHDFLEAVLDASRESGKLSVRGGRIKRVRAKEGYFNGGVRPYGYQPTGGKRSTLKVVESEAAIVREMVERVLNGESLRALVIDLNERGMKTVSGRRWYTATLRQYLKSPVIKGVRIHLVFRGLCSERERLPRVVLGRVPAAAMG
jgi:DNA invertase Pin-like site-specific DNA recombinase